MAQTRCLTPRWTEGPRASYDRFPMPLQTGERILHQIVSTVASSVELSEVLRAVVRLMSEASGVHGCFVYLVEDGGAHLVLRAASPPYERHIGAVARF